MWTKAANRGRKAKGLRAIESKRREEKSVDRGELIEGQG